MELPLSLDLVPRKSSFGAVCCCLLGHDRRLAKQLGLIQRLFDLDVHAGACVSRWGYGRDTLGKVLTYIRDEVT